ncbi:5'-nucleotidase domain-containing protein 3,5'-nucleotidase domain-containing protein 2 [Mytilus edulis]|uniref:5'-nucleotidase domain-containing protein 3,5'-nucleotidase domain-containing protein 2 n=1 Tax=Mytilus edulis TaxID=6550 RepID=A0A8S3TFP5_MYTED|nr:5'-nucleotidase domain-containing protein 3,5'-nucleotidase domain-containing protein 2 [Mytilus edulis]
MSAMKSTSALSKIFLRTFLENYKQNALPTCYRCLSSAAPNSKQSWTDKYKTKKKKIREKSEHVTVNQHAVFANNETSLKHIKVYGFDYDYTLASYKQELHSLIFRLGKDALVHKYKYPKDILKFEYSAEFAVRGLHYDIRKGLLMKLDSFHNIQLGTVYRGMQKVSDEEVIKLYDGTHVALESMNTFYGLGPMYQLVDLFAPPEMTLLTEVIEYFRENDIQYDPEYVFYDVRGAVQGIHSNGLLHNSILTNLEKYLEKGPKVMSLLENLMKADKKLFLITNSGFPFVDAGMTYMMGNDWRDLFEVIICNARKPKFFNEASRPFRIYDPSLENVSWDRVNTLIKGKVYQEGNFFQLRQMTGWYGSKVLYFGDHVYSDLADPSLKYGWRTGAIIPELETEIEKSNTLKFQVAVHWLCCLQDLIEESQEDRDPSVTILRNEWLKERDELRDYTKSLFNPHFGSIFRTYHNPTYFSRRLARFADIYMSDITDLLEYSTCHTFYPRRMALPHEHPPYADL